MPPDPSLELRSPATPEAFVEALGTERAVAVFLSLGGSTVYLSARPRPGSKLVALIGRDGAEALARTFGAGNLAVPLGNAIAARHLADQGIPRAEIARRLRVARETVRTHLATS